MLREALPEIVTGSVPGAKAKAILDRRKSKKYWQKIKAGVKYILET